MKTRPRPPTTPDACLLSLLFLLLFLLLLVAASASASAAGGAENSSASSSSSSSSSSGRQDEWAEEEEEDEDDGDEGRGAAAPSPRGSCPEDLCKISQLTDGGGALGGGAPGDPPVKVACHDHLRITSLEDVWPHCLPASTRILDLSASGLTRLPAGILSHLPMLEKLDLKKNDISVIEPGAFANLTNLRRLDLSSNGITSLNASHLAGLHKLKRLKLARNPLARIQEGILQELDSLKSLDLAVTQLVCDCGLTWLAKAVANKQLRLTSSSKCFRPRALNNTQIKKLTLDQLQCHGPGMSVVELEPGLDQVVFAGDSLRLRCRVTSAEEGHRVWWARGNTRLMPREPASNSSATVTGYLDQHLQREGAIIKNTFLPEAIESLVEIHELNGTHSGEWSCLVQGKQGNHTRTVSIYVIAHDTKYCPMNVTSNNRGSYVWSRTVAGVIVELPCAGLVPSHQRGPKFSTRAALSVSTLKVARHTCALDGQWHALDTSDCPFVSETTKILEHFASTNVSASKTRLVDSTRSLRNFTRDGKILHDAMDIVFLAKTVEQYTNLLGTLSGPMETALTLVDIISASMAATKELLYTAEVLDGACQRLLKCLWDVATYFPSLNRTAFPHIEMHQFSRQPETFSGLTCNWYRRSLHSAEKRFHCNTNNYSMYYSSDDEIMEAQIQVPSSLFSREQLRISNTSEEETGSSSTPSTVQFQFFVYDSANLFPRVFAGKSDNWEVTSSVIGARVSDQEEELQLQDNVYITLRSEIHSRNILPVWWKQNATSNQGNWTSEGCKIVRMLNSLIVFRCNRLAHFGLLEDMAASHRDQAGARGAEFRPSAPGVYVGSAICILFLMASIVTWAAHHHRIVTMNKNKHSLMNTWIALLLLVTLFTVGVYQTENQKLCQGIGVALHYLTTCVLLWIIVTVTNLYKKVTKALRPPIPVEDSPPDVPLPPKPMLRFYLVGWGIALILCGISAAVNLQQYAGYSYCFLAWGPSLGAFYAPTAALAFILSTFFLLTHCMLRSLRANYPEAAGATETTELELLDANSPTSENVNGPGEEELSIASRDTAVSVSDGQHSPLTQLRAHVVTLLLFILTWAAAAITTAAPFASVIPHHTTIFSIIYAICASSLGIFIFVFFCISRNDVWDAWREYSCPINKQRKEEEETHLTPANNSGANHMVVSNNQPRGPVGAPSTHSLDSSHTHQTNKSSSVSQSILTSNKPESLNKATNNLQLLSLGTMTNDLHYAPEIFYNPKQAGVAKRFFQKQRMRQMVKQNNLEINRTDSDCNSTVYKPKISRSINSESNKSNFDPSCLGASSKVNNTNIHVDSMYAYMPSEFQKGAGKHASKDPTPEVLCVLGPSSDNSKMTGLYPTMSLGRPTEVDRGWSTIPRKPRAFMEEPLSPMRRGGSFPSIVEEGQLTSQATSQSSALEQLSYISQEPLQQQRLCSYPVLGQIAPLNQQPVQYHNPRHHQSHLDEEAHVRKNRNSFNVDHTERADATGIVRGMDHSRMGRHHRYRSGRERPRPGRNRRKTSRLRGSCTHNEKNDWTDDNTSPIIINHLPSGEPGTRSSESDKDGLPHQFVSYPQHVHAISPPNTQRAILQTSLDSVNPALSAEQTGDMLCVDMSWPHVITSGMSGDKSGRTRSEKNNCHCLHAYSSNLDDSSHLAVGMCCEGHGEEGDCGAWDSECGDVYWCDGGGEERASVCEISGCENSSLCGGTCGVREDLCGSQSSEGGTSIGGASVDPAVGTSPRGSVNISDSPYDSPLHRLHQNTPDSGSLDSGLLGSPGRPPYDTALANCGPIHSTPKEGVMLQANDLPPCEGYTQGASTESVNTQDDLDSNNMNNSELLNATTSTGGSSGNSIFYLTNSSVETVLRNGDKYEGGNDSSDDGREGFRKDHGSVNSGSDVEDQKSNTDPDSESNPKRETCV